MTSNASTFSAGLGYCLFLGSLLAPPLDAQDPGTTVSSEFLPPIKVLADGVPIDTGKLVGYSGPTVIDHDRDGKLDLLVGSFSGKIQLFRNTGSNRDPVYAAGSFLQADGEDIEISNW